MERRLAITYIVSATTTFGIACVAIATAGGGLFASAAPKPAPGKQVEIIDDYIVVHSSTTVLAADAGDPTAASATSPKSALTRAPLPAAAGTAAPAPAPTVAPAEAVTADAPLSETPPTAAPTSAQMPEDPAPAPSPESDEPEPKPASAPAADPSPAPAREPAAAAPVPAARPPIPPGCHDPEFRNGTWKCDDD